MEHLEHHVGRYEDQHLLHGAPWFPSLEAEVQGDRLESGALPCENARGTRAFGPRTETRS